MRCVYVHMCSVPVMSRLYSVHMRQRSMHSADVKMWRIQRLPR